MKILIVDDHEIVIFGVKRYIQESYPDYVVHTAKNLTEMKSELREEHDLVILDVGYEDIDVFETIESIHNLWPDTKILIYTMHEEAGILRRLVEASVDAIVLKSSSMDIFLKTLQAIASGEEPEMNDKVKDLVKKSLKLPHLTATERNVLNLIRSGLSSCEMASRLNVSENTIEIHRRHLLSKLNARNVADLVVKATRAGW
ncbi:MAG: response regulator transcription factor [Muribaculaceae bacterium]